MKNFDPTRTTTLRRVFQTAMSKRFRLLNKRILDLVVTQDAFGLKKPTFNMNPYHDPDNGRFTYGPSGKKSEVADVPIGRMLATVYKNPTGEEVSRIVRRSKYPKGMILEGDVYIWDSHQHQNADAISHDAVAYNLGLSDFVYFDSKFYFKPSESGVNVYTMDDPGTAPIEIKKWADDNGFVLNENWSYASSIQKIEAFRLWLQEQMKSIITTEYEWWRTYVEDGYRKGAKRALEDVMKAMPQTDLDKPIGDWGKATQRQFMTSSFGRVVPVEKVKMLASRVFSDLDGITDYMETRIIRALTDGLTQGQHPNQMAVEMTKMVALGLDRAKTLARTEIIRSHAEGQLDSLEKLGVEYVGVTVEWSTAGDNHVCKLCKPLEGIVLTTKEMRGMIPRHFNCRCSIKPAGMIDRRGSQVKTKSKIDAAIAKSLGEERPKTKRSMAKQGKSTWVGAKLSVGKNRPQTVMG